MAFAVHRRTMASPSGGQPINCGLGSSCLRVSQQAAPAATTAVTTLVRTATAACCPLGRAPVGRTTTTTRGSVPGAAVSTTVTAATAHTLFGVPGGVLFSSSSALLVVVYALLAFFPHAKLTRSSLLSSPALYIGFSLLFCASLLVAWQTGFLAAALGGCVEAAWAAGAAGSLKALSLGPLAVVFSDPLVTLAVWLHLLTLDLLMAREVASDGIRTGTATAHSVLLCFFFGPTGLLSHAITRMLTRATRATTLHHRPRAAHM